MLAEVHKDYQIKRLSVESLVHVQALYRVIYKDLPITYFQKKYNTAYTGVEYIGCIAYDYQGLAVGCCIATPCFVRYRNEIFLAAQLGDAMTHPKFRHKGLFVELSTAIADLCRENGIRVLFGFPNQNSYHGLVQRVGWRVTDWMDCFQIPVVTFPLAKIANRLPFLQPFYQYYTKSVLNKRRINQSGVENSVVKEGFGGVHRNENYFQYKAYSNAFILRIGRAKVWVNSKNHLQVGDIDLCGENFDAVVKALRSTATFLGVCKIYFHACAGTQLHALLQARFQSRPSFPVLFQNLGAEMVLEEIKFTFSDIDIF